MTIATNQPIQQKPLSFDEFLARHGSDNRYELIDGEVFDLEPTGPHEEVVAFIAAKICVQIDGTVYLGLSFSGDCYALITLV